MTAAEARALCADLKILEWDDLVLERAITRATAAFLTASPQVTPAINEPGIWWVGAEGLDGVRGERALAQELLEIARVWHPRARVAVADSCVTARAATWTGREGASDAVIIPTGGDAAYLATAPLALIPMDDELRETLAVLGLRTAGAFAALDAEDVERRWGAAGMAAWRLSRGEDERRPVLARPEARRVAEAELAAPTDSLEPVLFLVRAALGRLVGGLVADGRAAAAVGVTLTLDGPRSALPSGAVAHTVTREARLPRPVARLDQLFEHCRALLERWTPGEPIAGVAVAITATAPAGAEQGDLLAPTWRDSAAADAAFARLRAELGSGAVVRPIARDEHCPERSGAWIDITSAADAAGADTVLSDEDGSTTAALVDARHLALRLLEVPEAIEVERSAGTLVGMWWRGCRSVIERAWGPERLSGDWWKDGYARDYWRCEGESGEFLIFRDRAAGQWFLHGWYD